MTVFAEALGQQIRTWRETRGLSIRQACDRYAAAMNLPKSIPASRWSAIEAGTRNVTIPELVGLSMALDVPVARLLGDDTTALEDTPLGINGSMSLDEIGGALKRLWVRHVDGAAVDAMEWDRALPRLRSQIAEMVGLSDDDEGRAIVDDAALKLFGCDVLTERESRAVKVVQERHRNGERDIGRDQVQRIRGHATRAIANEIYEAIRDGEV